MLKSLNPNYRPEVDGLRAIAVIAVLIFHAFPSVLPGGYLGVDVFFVISGFLITGIIKREIQREEFSFSHFYERRIRRIIPALYFVIIATFIIAVLLYPPSDLRNYAVTAFSSSLYFLNFVAANNLGYFDEFSQTQALLHIWSLSVEEQFYFLVPALLILASKFIPSQLPHLIALILLASYVFSGLNPSEPAYFYLTERAWELLTGSLLALLPYKSYRLSPVIKNLAVTVLLGSFIFFNKGVSHPGWLTALPVMSTLALLLPYESNNGLFRLLTNRVTLWAGTRSYSLYLWHFPLLSYVHYVSEVATYLWLSLALLGSFILAECSYRFVERPFRDSNLYSRKAIYAGFAISTFVIVAVSFIAFDQKGYMRSFTEQEIALFETAKESPKRDKCHGLPAEIACIYGQGPAKLAVFGDSHAVELAYALSTARSDAVLHLSYSGCQPNTLFAQGTYCKDWTDNSIKFLEQSSNIEEVIVSYRINNWLFGDHKQAYPQQPSSVSLGDRELVWASLVDILRRLVTAGKKVTYVEQAPELQQRIQTLFHTRQLSPSGYQILGVTEDWWNERNHWVTQRRSEFPAEVKIVNTSRLFCESGSCYAARENTSFYFDNNHMSVGGAEKVVEQIGAVTKAAADSRSPQTE